jgi:hypothetical protein
MTKALLVCAILAVIGYFFWRDLHLKPETVTERLPDVVVENLDFRRTIEGKRWHVRTDRAEHEGGIIRTKQVYVHVAETRDDGAKDMRLRATSGSFQEDRSDATLHFVDGDLSLPNRSVDMRAQEARYIASDDRWFFPAGLRLWDDTLTIEGRKGEISSDGLFSLWEGAGVYWKAEETVQ